MPYIGNVLTSFAVETGNINDQAVTAPKLSATGGSDGQVLALDSNLNLEWVSDPAGQWITNGDDIHYNAGNVGIGLASPSDLLEITPTSTREGLTIKTTGTTFGGINIDTNRTGAGHTLGDIRFMWNGTGVAGITGHTGADTTDKDDGRLIFNTASAGSATERMRIDSSGRLLVGTTSALDTSDEAIVHVVDALGARLVLGRNDTTVAAGNGLGGIRFAGNDTTSNTFTTLGEIICQADGTHAAGDNPTRLVFSTTPDNSSSVTERMRIDSSGNVGIGTNSPSQKLHIFQATDDDVGIRIQNNDGFAELEVDTDELNYNADSHVFNNQADDAERMRIDSNGRLCLGTTSSNALASFALSSTNAYSSTGNISNDNVGLRLFNTNGTDGTGVNNYTGIQLNVGSGATSSGSLAYVRTADNQGAFVFNQRTGATNFAEAMRIDNSGRLLIGTTSAREHLNDGSDSAQIFLQGTTQNTSTLAVIRGSDNDGPAHFVLGKSRGTGQNSTTVVQNNDNIGQINFEGADGTHLVRAAQIVCAVDGAPGANDIPGRLVFSTTADGAAAPTERLRITSDGTIQLRNSPGIDFSQIQTNAAGMTSETLDSYEEGTFTPSFAGATTSGTYGYNTRTGHYTRIGDMVNVTVKMTNISGNAGAGDINIRGLPFTSADNSSFACGSIVLDSFNVADTTVSIATRMDPNTAILEVLTIRDDATDSALEVGDKSGNNADIFCTITYRV